MFLPFHVHDNNFVTIFTFFGIGFLFQMLVGTTSNMSNVWSNILTSSSHLTFSTGFFFSLYFLFRKKNTIKCGIISESIFNLVPTSKKNLCGNHCPSKICLLPYPLLLADGTLRCGMYPAGKVAISWHLATPGFPQWQAQCGRWFIV